MEYKNFTRQQNANDMSELLSALYYFRHLAGLKQAELAKKAGIHKVTMSRLEMGNFAYLNTDTIFKLFKALDIIIILKFNGEIGQPLRPERGQSIKKNIKRRVKYIKVKPE